LGWLVCLDREPFHGGLAMGRLNRIAVNAKKRSLSAPASSEGLFGCLRQPSDQSLVRSTVSVGTAPTLKRQRILLRFEAVRSLRCLRSVGVSKARRRRISSSMPSPSSFVLRRLRARSTGSPFFTFTPRMLIFFVGCILCKFFGRGLCAQLCNPSSSKPRGVSFSESEADEAGNGEGVAELLGFSFKELVDGDVWIFHESLL